jgi:hypothetical protein
MDTVEKQIAGAFWRGKQNAYYCALREARYYQNCAKLYATHGNMKNGAIVIQKQLAVINAKIKLAQAKRLRKDFGLSCRVW